MKNSLKTKKRKRELDLDDRVANFIKLVPSTYISEILDNPDVKTWIDIHRRKKISNNVLREVVSGLSTYSFFNVLQKPWFFGGTILADSILSAGSTNYSFDYENQVIIPLLRKTYELIEHEELIQNKLNDYGFEQMSLHNLPYSVVRPEDVNYGINEITLLSRPLVQAVSALGSMPPLLIGIATGIPYLTLPLFSKLANRYLRSNQASNLMGQSYRRTNFKGDNKLVKQIEELKDRFLEKEKNQKIVQRISKRLPDIAFLIGSMITQDDSAAQLRVFQQLMNVPFSYVDLKQKKNSIT